jgi:hypothetical protein
MQAGYEWVTSSLGRNPARAAAATQGVVALGLPTGLKWRSPRTGYDHRGPNGGIPQLFGLAIDQLSSRHTRQGEDKDSAAVPERAVVKADLGGRITGDNRR